MNAMRNLKPQLSRLIILCKMERKSQKNGKEYHAFDLVSSQEWNALKQLVQVRKKRNTGF